MKKMMTKSMVVGLLFTLFVSGCTSIRATHNFNGQMLSSKKFAPIAHINTQISGVYLFNIIPIITGDPDFDSSMDFSLFKDNVTLSKCVGMLTKKSKTFGGKAVLDMTSHMDSTGYVTFWILWYKTVEVSGNVVK